MGFSTKGVVVSEGNGIGKYLSYGVQKAAIVGYELKESQSGKQQVVLLMESPKVKEAGFEPDEKAKFGGKVGRVNFTIYFGKDDKSQVDQFMMNIATIAKKLGLTEKVDAIEADTVKSYLDKLMPIIAGKFAWWGITAEEYQKKDSDKVGYSLGLRRYGFIASLDEMEANPNHIKPFDKGNVYDYKPLAAPSKDPDVDPITEAFGTDSGMPWDN